MTIWKFNLRVTDVQAVEMPRGAEILSVQVRRGQLCLWAQVQENAPKEKREIEIIGTGHPIEPAKRKFIGTVQVHNETLVWHIYERL